MIGRWNNGTAICIVDAVDTNTHVAGDGTYLYNDSTIMYFNETKLNTTINYWLGDMNNYSLEQIAANIGNWSDDSSSYYNITEVDYLLTTVNITLINVTFNLNGSYVPYTGANQTVNLNEQDLIGVKDLTVSGTIQSQNINTSFINSDVSNSTIVNSQNVNSNNVTSQNVNSQDVDSSRMNTTNITIAGYDLQEKNGGLVLTLKA